MGQLPQSLNFYALNYECIHVAVELIQFVVSYLSIFIAQANGSKDLAENSSLECSKCFFIGSSGCVDSSVVKAYDINIIAYPSSIVLLE